MSQTTQDSIVDPDSNLPNPIATIGVLVVALGVAYFLFLPALRFDASGGEGLVSQGQQGQDAGPQAGEDQMPGGGAPSGGGSAPSGGGGGPGAGGGGGFDPEAIFAQRDADGNGALEGDEISGRMVERLESIDSDGDGKVTKEEFMTAIQNRGGGGRRGGGRPGGEGRPGGSRPSGELESDNASNEASSDQDSSEDS